MDNSFDLDEMCNRSHVAIATYCVRRPAQFLTYSLSISEFYMRSIGMFQKIVIQRPVDLEITTYLLIFKLQTNRKYIQDHSFLNG